MAPFESVLSVLKPGKRRGPVGGGGLRAGRNIVRGATGRAYDFEALPIADVVELIKTPAVYMYARNLAAEGAHVQGLDATIEHYALGYIAETEDLGAAAEAHERAQHFRGHGFDVVLFVRIEQDFIRTEIAEDLIALHRPVLNDLLRSHKRAE